MEANAKPQRKWLAVAVAGDSMLPTLRNGDFVLFQRSKRFRPGQIVLLEDPSLRLVIKRLVNQDNDSWWVLGDNESQSTDSRHYGLVANEQIKAIARFRYWPKPKIIK